MSKKKDYVLSEIEKQINKRLPEPFFPFSTSGTFKQVLLFILIILNGLHAFSQNDDNKKSPLLLGGTILVTNNGMSTIPNLSLGKPATIFDLKIAKGKLSFEPQLRFALKGKPWGFLFWWRYKLLESDKFRFIAGVNPALSFKTISVTNEGVSKEYMIVRRILTGELAPTCIVSKKISLGIYWMYSYGVEKESVRHNNFISVRSIFSNIKLSSQYQMRFAPQVYWLNLDEKSGFYVGSTLSLSKSDFPFSIASTMNKAIKTEIVQGRNFLWNIGIVYTFNGKYVKV
ncbi:MAG TPA: hypothetical protein VGK38_11460 [Prolixibacteraceae bacterium]|jgi:hypothetical protein